MGREKVELSGRPRDTSPVGRNKPGSPWKKTRREDRNKPKVELTLSDEEHAALEELAREEAKVSGGRPNRSKVVGALVLAAHKKRGKT